MKYSPPRGYSTFVGMGIIIFVILVGALGYKYVLSYKAEVARGQTGSNQIAAQTMKVPTVNNTDDLDAALVALDTASQDNLSQTDLNSLEAELSKF